MSEPPLKKGGETFKKKLKNVQGCQYMCVL